MMEILKHIFGVFLKGFATKGQGDGGGYVSTTETKVSIVIDKQIREKYRAGWINKYRKKDIDEIVIHGTAGGTSIDGLLSWMFGGERAKEYNQGIALFHYGIGQDGRIVEVLDPAYWVYHSSSGWHDKKTVGIELMNPDKANALPYTDAQYKALFELIFDHLVPLYPSITRIVSHNFNQQKYSGYGKQCPGQGFDWNKLVAEFKRRKIDVEVTGEVFVFQQGDSNAG